MTPVQAAERLNQCLRDFMESPKRNVNLYADSHEINARVYVRKGLHRINEQVGTFLDLANICIFPERTGTFSKFLPMAEATAKEFNMDGVYVECIMNEHLRRYLARVGYEIAGPGGSEIISMVKFKEQIHESN